MGCGRMNVKVAEVPTECQLLLGRKLLVPEEDDQVLEKGTMNFVDNRIDPGSGTIRARAILPNEDLFITPGQFGRVRIPGSNEYEAILIPDSAIVVDQSNRIVMTVDSENTVVPKIIRPGPSQPGGLRIVREGLTGDEQIIINGLIRARPGAKVTPQPGTIAPESSLTQN